MTDLSQEKPLFTAEQLENLQQAKELIPIAAHEKIDISQALKTVEYNEELRNLQIELVKLQRWIYKNKKRVAIIFEGRDAAGKGGNIRRFSEHLNPRTMRTVALTKPTEIERGQWYFERYIKELPNPGEIVFFDRKKAKKYRKNLKSSQDICTMCGNFCSLKIIEKCNLLK